METLTRPKPIGPLAEHLVLRDVPAFLNGWAIRCLICSCHVSMDHRPNSECCLALIEERYWKRRLDV